MEAEILSHPLRALFPYSQLSREKSHTHLFFPRNLPNAAVQPVFIGGLRLHDYAYYVGLGNVAGASELIIFTR